VWRHHCSIQRSSHQYPSSADIQTLMVPNVTKRMLNFEPPFQNLCILTKILLPTLLLQATSCGQDKEKCHLYLFFAKGRQTEAWESSERWWQSTLWRSGSAAPLPQVSGFVARISLTQMDWQWTQLCPDHTAQHRAQFWLKSSIKAQKKQTSERKAKNL